MRQRAVEQERRDGEQEDDRRVHGRRHALDRLDALNERHLAIGGREATEQEVCNNVGDETGRKRRDGGGDQFGSQRQQRARVLADARRHRAVHDRVQRRLVAVRKAIDGNLPIRNVDQQ